MTRTYALLLALSALLCAASAGYLRMLVAFSDPIGKDAWSRTHEVARSITHQSLVLEGHNINCSIFQSYSAEDMTALFSSMIDSGEQIDLIVLTSSEYVSTSYNLTDKYPTQKIMTVATRPRNAMINIGTRGYEAYYLAGRACGLVTESGSVGLVGLTPTGGSWSIANAVYEGLRSVAPDATLTLMYINDFYLPPVEAATATFLVEEHGVDCGISQSLNVNEQWGKEDIWVVGVAADYRYDVNENVLVSFVYNWEVFYQTVTRSILNGNFSALKNDLSYGFSNGVIETSAFSTLASNDFERDIVEQASMINPDQLFCGEIAARTRKNTNGTCLNRSEIRSMTFYMDGIITPRNLTMEDITERIVVEYGSGLGVAVLVLNGLVMVLSVAMIVNTLVYRNTVVIRSSAYIFCVLVLLGVVLGALSSYFWLGEPTDAYCMLRAWLGGLGFSISFGGLIVKNYRIWRIFSVSSLDTKIADSDRALILKGILPMLGLEAVILVLWTTIDPMRVTEVMESPFLAANQLYVACRSEGVWPVVIFFVPKGVMLIFGTVVSYKTRDIKSQFKQYKESKEIGWCIMVTVLFAVFVLMINFMVEFNLLAEVGAFTIAIFAVTASLLGFVFGPKVWRLNIKGDKRETRSNLSAQHTSSTRNTTNSLHKRGESTRSEELKTENESDMKPENEP